MAFAGGSAAAAPSAQCTLAKIADMPVRVVHNKLMVDGAINGQPVGVMLDTGAMRTLITRPAANRLGLVRQQLPNTRVIGVGGKSQAEWALVDELTVGDATVKNRRMMVAGERDIGDDVAVVLGEDFFRVVDVEFDLGHNVVRLFQAKDCDHSSLAYWAPGGAGEVPIERVHESGPSIVLTVKINGRPMSALLDSGAAASVLDRSDAARARVVGEQAVGMGTGIGAGLVAWSFAPVESFVIGDESIKDTTLAVGDLFRDAGRLPLGGRGLSMLLGADFLRAHRVLVAHSQQKMYFTYVGGPVFQGREAARSMRDPDGVIAYYDAAIKSDGQNSLAYVRRGNAWMEKKEYDRAIADYDASLRIEPRASTFANRGSARIAKGDYAEGIADATRAMELDPKYAPAYLTRGTGKQRSGDFEGAIADWSRAVELDPKLAAGYNRLAWAWATAARPSDRDGRRAVESAIKACELTQWKNPGYLDTLAAAYARTGNFEDAVKWQKKAIEGPGPLNDATAAAQRLQLYEERKAWPDD